MTGVASKSQSVVRRLPSLLALFVAALLALGRSFFEDGEVDFLFYRVDAVDQDPEFLADAVGLARMLPDNLTRVLVVGVAVVGQGAERDQAFNEQVSQFDE